MANFFSYNVIEILSISCFYIISYFFLKIFPLPIASPLFDFYLVLIGISLLIKLKNENQNILLDVVSKLLLYYSLNEINRSKIFLTFFFCLFSYYLYWIRNKNKINSIADLKKCILLNLGFTELKFTRKAFAPVFQYYVIIIISGIFSVMIYA